MFQLLKKFLFTFIIKKKLKLKKCGTKPYFIDKFSYVHFEEQTEICPTILNCLKERKKNKINNNNNYIKILNILKIYKF